MYCMIIQADSRFVKENLLLYKDFRSSAEGHPSGGGGVILGEEFGGKGSGGGGREGENEKGEETQKARRRKGAGRAFAVGAGAQ